MQENIRARVAIIIPCYKAKNKVGILCNKILKIASKLSDICSISIFIVDDFCPEKSYLEVTSSEIIKVINNKNLTVFKSIIILSNY